MNTIDIFTGNATHLAYPSYGDSAPCYMLPEHHPDYRKPPKLATVRRQNVKDLEPFNYLSTFSNPPSLAATAKRLSHGKIVERTEIKQPTYYGHRTIVHETLVGTYEGLTRNDRGTW